METMPGSRNMLENVSLPTLVLLLLTTFIAGGIILLIRYAVSRRSRSSLEQDSSKSVSNLFQKAKMEGMQGIQGKGLVQNATIPGLASLICLKKEATGLRRLVGQQPAQGIFLSSPFNFVISFGTSWIDGKLFVIAEIWEIIQHWLLRDLDQSWKPAAPAAAPLNCNVNYSQIRNDQRIPPNNKRNRQNSDHSWLTTTLRGHTGPILDMGFSNNGKYVASSAEDRSFSPENVWIHEIHEMLGQISTTSMLLHSHMTNPRMNHNLFDYWNHGEYHPERRRQVTTMIRTDNAYRRGNRRVRQPIWRPRYFPSGNTDTDVDRATENDNLQHDTYERQNMFQIDHNLYRALKNYMLKPNELKERGFPVESHDFPGHAMIKNISYPTGRNLKRSDTWNIDDQDSGCSSDSTSEHEQENSSDKCFDGEKNSNGEEKSVDNDSASAKKCDSSSQQGKRECVRCHKSFYVDQTGKYLNKERCVYHWGKFFNGLTNGETNRKYWTCCARNLEFTRGCAEAEVHVWNGLIQPEENGPLAGYVRILPYNPQTHNDNYNAYALDCEMCYTQYGLELTKVTLVDLCGNIIYNKFVKPRTKIIDYNTRFNGITEEQMLNVTTTLKDVQRELRTLVHTETILLGHNLASDFRALRLFHDKVVDTTALIPHKKGFPFCNALKTLARGVNRRIQENAHDSIEDARVVVDIVLRKVQYDLNKSRSPQSDRNESLVIGMESTYA